jgi:hypothetical protein
MRREIPGLHLDTEEAERLEGVFLVRIEQAQRRFERRKSFYVLSFRVIQPQEFFDRGVVARLYSTPRALWKLRWFLRDLAYDNDLLQLDVIDESALAGLRGVVKVSYANVHGRLFLNLDGFAPATAWEELSATALEQTL